MRPVLTSKTITIPPEITKVTVRARQVAITGKRGTLRRDFRHFACDMRLLKNAEGQRQIHIDLWFGNKKQVAGARTIETHIKNMIDGVTKGYLRKMRFVFAHFPIQCTLPEEDPVTGAKVQEGKIVEIRNFLGEHRVRRVDMLDGVICKRGGKDEIIIEGNDIELVSRSAALINQACHVKNKDIRKFLDGCYVSEASFIEQE
jgi:large subunit ribosomal protein L9e